VIPAIEEHRAALLEICRQHHVQRLALFGSAARDDFDLQRSDLDFLVEFAPQPTGGRAASYFGLLEDLGALFGRRVDLVTASAIKNPYFLAAVNESQVLLYAA
jgi:predicted nucleotidyltransferase